MRYLRINPKRHYDLNKVLIQAKEFGGLCLITPLGRFFIKNQWQEEQNQAEIHKWKRRSRLGF